MLFKIFVFVSYIFFSANCIKIEKKKKNLFISPVWEIGKIKFAKFKINKRGIAILKIGHDNKIVQNGSDNKMVENGSDNKMVENGSDNKIDDDGDDEDGEHWKCRSNQVKCFRNKSYEGTKYIFNKIFNDNIKQNGDKASELLFRANYIKEINGLYNMLPLGMRVINKIKDFINNYLEKINSHSVFLSILQPKRLWNISDRSKLYSEEFLYVYKQKQQKVDTDLGEIIKKKYEDDGNILSPTCEEIALTLINEVYNLNATEKNFPLLIHQYNYKFRNEKRLEKSLFKSKEFLMKDGYSFHANKKCMDEIYEIYKECYKNIFNKLGLTYRIIKKRKKDKMNALESHEYQILCRDGKFKEGAHIFKLGDYYSKKLNINYLNKKNEKKNIYMGSYGIGINRLLYFLIDNFYDENGIKLPNQIAPFSIYLIQTNQKSKYSSEKVNKIVNELRKEIINDNNTTLYNSLNSNDIEYILTIWLYTILKENDIDTYYDNTDLHLSRKLKNCDLIGASNRVIINLKSDEKKKIKLPPDFYNYLNDDNNNNRHNIFHNKLYQTFKDIRIEYKNRFFNETKNITIHELLNYFHLV
ncbi:prolyl-tRNA synthetase [Plasmodium yoelii]|uniref:Prolyl-tRNA synthetase-related n=3 Tax=Plasmodium yoelii TaxID=5861 RepID=Q7RR10_PLAYO|nr:prolyl-tRNA synthetase [Plasmodium yoelii]EAA19351.1 prolyl-tRNA synthetase-related [Plasmodium yoelii yoelii]CDU17653.1 proline--tRNA ligase, putative [Plasmodium yoelii]VTZ77584.1 proline--tRNA ligase, putative [Plasmodium yoelii]|eukprot:XP_727786.1 prolyl-tRNA synthetase [Plasmodium yoelii]